LYVVAKKVSPQSLWITLFISLSLGEIPSYFAASNTSLPRI
jgi:hypothetical protein